MPTFLPVPYVIKVLILLNFKMFGKNNKFIPTSKNKNTSTSSKKAPLRFFLFSN